MMQMIAGAMEAQRWEPLRTSQDIVSPPRNVPMLLDIARFRNDGFPKRASYQCLSKIDGADTFRQHEVTDGTFQQRKQCVAPAVCALKIRVSLVRFRSWAPFSSITSIAYVSVALLGSWPYACYNLLQVLGSIQRECLQICYSNDVAEYTGGRIAHSEAA